MITLNLKNNLPKFNRFSTQIFLAVMVGLFSTSQESWAIDPIIRPYMSARSLGMGGVRLTTGLYDENFFNNPARITSNPESKFTLLQITPEVNTDLISASQTLSDGLTSVLNSNTGKNIHARVQFILPTWYLATKENRRFSIALGMMGGFQTDLNLSNSFRSDADVILDLGPALTFGYQLLTDRTLSIGVTAHANYRFSGTPNVSLLDVIGGQSLALSNMAGQGAMYNFDLGATWKFLQLDSWEINAAAAVQNIMGGNYSIQPIQVAAISSQPTPQPKSYGVGISAFREYWGSLSRTSIAIEATDILNNTGGSIYRLLHLGIETNWKAIGIRAGLNQGYWTAGLGIDLFYLTLNFATYGEELGLNSGVREDRRYTASIGLHL